MDRNFVYQKSPTMPLRCCNYEDITEKQKKEKLHDKPSKPSA